MSSSSRNSDHEEETSSNSSEVLENGNKRVSEILNRETKRFLRLDTLDESAKKPERVNFPKMLKLDIGGHLFSTSLDTLTKDPGSMLHAMFTRKSDTNKSEDGSYFIDRDGTHFRYILNYLRTGEFVVPKDEIVREELLAEAKFYRVEGMIKALTPAAFVDSVILSSEQRQTMINWLKEIRNFTNANLLYRASSDGWAASSFHSCCDNKGPTVTLVKSGNYIFGGNTEQRWDALSGSRVYKKSLRLVPLQPCQPKRSATNKAAWCSVRYGPVFGSGCDLCIANKPNSNNCGTNLDNTYQCPAGQKADTSLTGDQFFNVSEMDVFGFVMICE